MLNHPKNHQININQQHLPRIFHHFPIVTGHFPHLLRTPSRGPSRIPRPRHGAMAIRPPSISSARRCPMSSARLFSCVRCASKSPGSTWKMSEKQKRCVFLKNIPIYIIMWYNVCIYIIYIYIHIIRVIRVYIYILSYIYMIIYVC